MLFLKHIFLRQPVLQMKMVPCLLLSLAYSLANVREMNDKEFLLLRENPSPRNFDPPIGDTRLEWQKKNSDAVERAPCTGPGCSGLPRRTSRLVRQGAFKAGPDAVREILIEELKDVSKDLRKKFTGQIERTDRRVYDKVRFKPLFVISKHVVNDGKRKIVKIDVKKRIVPRDPSNVERRDIAVYAFPVCIAFLLIGLVFTSIIKTYRRTLMRRNRTKGLSFTDTEVASHANQGNKYPH